MFGSKRKTAKEKMFGQICADMTDVLGAIENSMEAARSLPPADAFLHLKKSKSALVKATEKMNNAIVRLSASKVSTPGLIAAWSGMASTFAGLSMIIIAPALVPVIFATTIGGVAAIVTGTQVASKEDDIDKKREEKYKARITAMTQRIVATEAAIDSAVKKILNDKTDDFLSSPNIEKIIDQYPDAKAAFDAAARQAFLERAKKKPVPASTNGKQLKF